MKRGEKTESTLVHAAREMGERTEERGTEVPDTDVTLSLYVHVVSVKKKTRVIL